MTNLENNIKAVITACKNYRLNHSNSNLPDYLHLPALDHTDFNLTVFFEQSQEFLDKCLNYTNVLVHCVAGISRSASIVVAYLMKKLEYTSTEAIKLLQSRREMVMIFSFRSIPIMGLNFNSGSTSLVLDSKEDNPICHSNFRYQKQKTTHFPLPYLIPLLFLLMKLKHSTKTHPK